MPLSGYSLDRVSAPFANHQEGLLLEVKQTKSGRERTSALERLLSGVKRTSPLATPVNESMT
jgi:hypothetical protein